MRDAATHTTTPTGGRGTSYPSITGTMREESTARGITSYILIEGMPVDLRHMTSVSVRLSRLQGMSLAARPRDSPEPMEQDVINILAAYTVREEPDQYYADGHIGNDE